MHASFKETLLNCSIILLQSYKYYNIISKSEFLFKQNLIIINLIIIKSASDFMNCVEYVLFIFQDIHFEIYYIYIYNL